ncbi:MOSC domain-containing protein [Calothrix sp. 336/3]|uniref:MOSC domain-containing protein n=1 Tax=Calothrix sp. 336/3 TaxID=1337936 RepID=UPI0004E444F2|nr:MOSC N-terminal beta barrel domain-containing protein [Calothrix sp. 336/3]AKG23601.1 molybdenum cofactor biosysynthesis protein [Calothrix sp. 336/3]
MVSPHLAKIFVYPIKSLDGVELDRVTVLPSGALAHDRELAIADKAGKFVNAKRYAKIHLLRSSFDLNSRTVTLSYPDSPSLQTFHLDRERQSLENYLSLFFGFSVELQANLIQGFPDDTKSPGPTIISSATLTEVASWYPDMSVAEMRRRIRANLEIDGVPAFWEDSLYGEEGSLIPFQVGNVKFLGINPCQRCIVPTRDSFTGEADSQFQKVFVSKRQQTLPPWAINSRFNHYYRLSINTRLASYATVINVTKGEAIEIL